MRFVAIFLGCLLIGPLASAQTDFNNLSELANGIFSGAFNAIDAVAQFVEELVEYPNLSEAIQLYCANPTTKTFRQLYINDNNTKTAIDFTKEIGFITHGWNDDAGNKWAKPVATDWVKYRNVNVCIVNWSRLSILGYISAAVRSTRITARYITEYIKSLEQYGVKPENVTLVGHSLGAHVMGFVGQHFSGKIKKIIGMDAAGPLFTIPIPLPLEWRLDGTDAQQVQCIHSGDFLTGYTIPCGNQDFYGNLGTAPQLGCVYPVLYTTYGTDPIRCSHNRAIDWFQSSLNPRNNKCVAIQCDNSILYGMRSCRNNYNKVGLDSTDGLKGQFYFATGGRPTCTGSFWNFCG